MLGSNITTARMRLALEGQGEVVRGLGEVQSGLSGMRRAVASLAGGLSLGAAVGQLVSVQREMDVLNASLVTVTGSSAAADQNLRWIKTFAANTPFQLNEVTGAFIKMKALGLDASEAALRSYGNTASAMGKDLNQFIEAVADAATGEFERLKEFGIKAKKQGDDVSFTFRGVTTNIRNNAAEITQYLQNIGNTDFAGAMDRRVSTLDGAISNLSDTWDELFRTVNEAGVGSLIETTVRGATRAIGGLGDVIRGNKAELTIIGSTLAGTALVATLPRMASGFLLVAGAVKALGLALVANPLTLALLGIGAGAGALVGFNAAKNTTVEGIKKQINLIEQAEAVSRRSNLDAATAEALRIKRTEQLLQLRQKLKELEGPAEGSVPSGDVALRRAEAAAAAGTAAAAGAADGLNPKGAKGKKVKDALDELHMYSADTQAKFAQILIDKTADWQAEALQEQLASNQVESFFRMAEVEAEARWQAQQDKASKAAQDAADKLRDAEVAEWEKVNDQITQSLTDSLFDGGKSFLDNLASYARTVVLRPILAPLGAGLASLLTGGSAQAGQDGGLGDFSSLSNLLDPSAIFTRFGDSLATSAFKAGQWLEANTSGYLNQLGGQLTSNANLLGTAGSYLAGAGTGIAAGRFISGGYSAVGKSGNTAVNVGTVAGAVLGGPIGAAIGGAIGGAVNRLFGRKLAGQGIQGDFSSAGFTGNSYTFEKGGLFRSDKTSTSALDPATAQALGDQFKAITASTAAAAKALGFDTGNLAGITWKGLSINTLGQSQEQIDAFFASVFQDIADYQANSFAGVAQFSRDGENTSTTLQRLATSLTGVNSVLDTLGQRALAVSAAGGNAASTLADLFGGLEAFGQSTAAYYQAFYSQGERTATTTRQLTTALGALGLQLPGSREGFRALVEAQDLNTEAGRKAYATLLQLAPAFADISTSVEDLAQASATAAKEMADAMAQAGSSISDEIARLRGLTTSSATAQGLAALQGRFATTTAQARAGSVDALNQLPGISQALDEAASLQATTAQELRLIRQQTATSLQATLGALGLAAPALGTGGAYVPGTTTPGATVPAAYSPASSSTPTTASNVELLAEVRSLRQAQQQAQPVLEGMALAAAKTARILERAQPTGDALLIMTQTELDAL
jgi:hypothetical protein